jgi:hypothetical protein
MIVTVAGVDDSLHHVLPSVHVGCRAVLLVLQVPSVAALGVCIYIHQVHRLQCM